jgi:hypothetical protein
LVVSQSNLQKTSGIREHRATEKEERREIEAFELQPDKKPLTPQKTEKPTQDAKPSSSPQSAEPNHLDLLAKKRKERKGGK